MTTLPPYWLSRAIIATLSMCMALVALLEPATMVHKVLTASGPGWWCLGALLAVAALALLDVAINDLTPPNIAVRWARRIRPLIYMALALGNMSVSFVLAKNSGINWLHAQLWLVVIVATGLAFQDVFYKHKKGDV